MFNTNVVRPHVERKWSLVVNIVIVIVNIMLNTSVERKRRTSCAFLPLFSIDSTPIPRAPKLKSVTTATIICVTFSSHVILHVSRREMTICDCSGCHRIQRFQWGATGYGILWVHVIIKGNDSPCNFYVKMLHYCQSCTDLLEFHSPAIGPR